MAPWEEPVGIRARQQEVSCRLLVVNCQFSVVNCRFSVVNCRFSVNCRISVVNCRFSVVSSLCIRLISKLPLFQASEGKFWEPAASEPAASEPAASEPAGSELREQQVGLAIFSLPRYIV